MQQKTTILKDKLQPLTTKDSPKLSRIILIYLLFILGACSPTSLDPTPVTPELPAPSVPSVTEVETACTGTFDTSPTAENEFINFTIDGTKAILRGTLDSSTPTKVNRLINNNPEVRIIVLAFSPGSADDDSNIRASLAVHNANIATCVPDNGVIASGAVDFFLAGSRRRLGENTFVGVHSWADDRGVEGKDLPRNHPDHDLFLDYYNAIGVSEAFYFFTLQAAPSNDIHNMTETERTQFTMETP